MNLRPFQQKKEAFCKFSSFLTTLHQGEDHWIPSFGQLLLSANIESSEPPVSTQKKCWFL